MLQISNGIYFDSDDPYETVHRRVVYTNGIRVRAEDIELPIGILRFTNGHGGVRPIVVEAVDRLEKTAADGSPSLHVATGGDELIDDVIDVVAFGLDVVVLADPDLTQRVVDGVAHGARRRGKLLRRILEPGRFISDEEITELRSLCTKLLALQRPHFEATMRAIRRVADAVTLTSSDVTLSYTLFVAALESLAQDSTAPNTTWDQYDSKKRRVIDAACAELDETQTETVRAAVLEIDALALRRKFQGFVLDHVAGDYYRGGARDAIDPIRAVDLPKALDFAYQVRSKTVHELRDLAPELRELAQQGDTVEYGGKTVLSLEGLHRLCQHVIREYIDRSPTGVDPVFKQQYRSSLPGLVRVRLAYESWLPRYDGFKATDVPLVFSGLVDSMHRVAVGEAEGIVDIRIPLRRIESHLKQTKKEALLLPMVATYDFWNGTVAEDLQMHSAAQHLEPHLALLTRPSIYAYALWAFGRSFEWDEQSLAAIADEREAFLSQQRKDMLELPTRLDATLRLDLAQRALNDGRQGDSLNQIGKAIELLPGNEVLMSYESQIRNDGTLPEFDVREFFLMPSKSPDSQDTQQEDATHEV